jgi:hypothetical protein
MGRLLCSIAVTARLELGKSFTMDTLQIFVSIATMNHARVAVMIEVVKVSNATYR